MGSGGYTRGSVSLSHSPVALSENGKGALFPVLLIPGLGLIIRGFRNIPVLKVLIPECDGYAQFGPTPGLYPPKCVRNVGNPTVSSLSERCVSDSFKTFRRPCDGEYNCSQNRQKGVPEGVKRE